MYLHSLFIRPRRSAKGTRWNRVFNSAYTIEQARRIYQNALLFYTLETDQEARLRPVKSREDVEGRGPTWGPSA